MVGTSAAHPHVKRIAFSAGVFSLLGLLGVEGCIGDDDVYRPIDAGIFDAAGGPSRPDRVVPTEAAVDAALLACGDAGGGPLRALVVQSLPRASELAAVNLETGAVDGRLGFDAGSGLTSSLGGDPYLLSFDTDVVTRLDARQPWHAVTSWNVRGDDALPGREANAYPVAVVPVSCSKAYVLRYNRNRIAIIDPSQPNGGAPTGYIDLAAYRAPAAGVVAMTSAAFVSATKRMYVLLGQVDSTQAVTVNGEARPPCISTLKPTLIAVDVEADKVVSLGGTGPGGGIELEGSRPAVGTPLVYDPAFDRILVLESGCWDAAPPRDGGAAGFRRRRVEQVVLATGAVKMLLDLDNQGMPGILAFADGEHAALGIRSAGFLWDPREPTLGAPIDGGIERVAVDGLGDFIGARSTASNGSAGPVEVLRIPRGGSDAGVSVVVRGPFSRLGGNVSGIEAWPRP
jgi:hypothetical protein